MTGSIENEKKSVIIGNRIYAQLKPVDISSYLHYQVNFRWPLTSNDLRIQVESCYATPNIDGTTKSVQLIKESECSLERVSERFSQSNERFQGPIRTRESV